MNRFAKIFIVLVLIFSKTNAQNDIAGYWSGKIKMLTMNLDFQIKVDKTKKPLQCNGSLVNNNFLSKVSF